jgi:hypothetical protein
MSGENPVRSKTSNTPSGAMTCLYYYLPPGQYSDPENLQLVVRARMAVNGS